MNINQLLKDLKIKINNETHTPQEWDKIAHDINELARFAHSRIPDCHELERVDEAE